MDWRTRLLALMWTSLSFQYLPRISLLLSFSLRKLVVKLAWWGICSFATMRFILAFTVLFMELVCPSHLKISLRLESFHKASSSSSLPLSAHLSAFSLKNSPLWALILINRVNSPLESFPEVVRGHWFEDDSKDFSIRSFAAEDGV